MLTLPRALLVAIHPRCYHLETLRQAVATLTIAGDELSLAGGRTKSHCKCGYPVSIKRRFKSHAALRGMEPNELFVVVWEHYEASLKSEAVRHGGTL